MIKRRAGETVVFSCIVFESRAHRDKVNTLVMNVPMMNDSAWTEKPMPFDINRMAYGGFEVIAGGK